VSEANAIQAQVAVTGQYASPDDGLAGAHCVAQERAVSTASSGASGAAWLAQGDPPR